MMRERYKMADCEYALFGNLLYGVVTIAHDSVKLV